MVHDRDWNFYTTHIGIAIKLAYLEFFGQNQK